MMINLNGLVLMVNLKINTKKNKIFNLKRINIYKLFFEFKS